MADKSRPEWIQPTRNEEPVLKVYNSLTKSKVQMPNNIPLPPQTEFVPKKGRNVTWYNCGPTVYDSSHMGHARNYLTQDIIRRILTDYFGYDVHFVMNITDIDDKIIIRARHQYHLDTISESTPSVTPELIILIENAWLAYLHKQLSKGLEDKSIIVQGQELASWQKIEELAKDNVWVQAGNARDEKFAMHLKALRDTHLALSSARATQDGPAPSKPLITTSAPILAPYLDAQHLSQPNPTPIPSHLTRALSSYWEHAFMRDMDRLGVRRPDTLTRVTEYVPEIVSFVEKIVERGWAYEAGGSVYFDVRAYDGVRSKDADWEHIYAKLQPHSKNNTALLEEGEGALSTGDTKRSPADFALWKRSKPGEPEWPSVWGPGRPGWHIECSVMASAILGDGMDIHSGGIDLAFPHHDNEIAQSEAYHDCRQWVNYFLHTGHLHIEGQKMSKSLKNFITVEEALKMYSSRQIRLAFLAQAWNARMDFKESLMVEVRSQETVFNNFFALAKALVSDEEAAAEKPPVEEPRHNYGEAEAELTALQLAMSGASAKDILALCDRLRDVDLIPLGVALDDQDDGKALVKLVSPDVLIKARDEKLAALAEKSAKKSAQADAAKAKQLAKLEKGKISPSEMFRPPNVPEGTYGSWDDKGIPTTDGEGADITKSRLKRLMKEWEIQSKLHEEWKEWAKANS
ncbi:hypothetical protein FRC07_007353 [Ceratobasidium sp. 392]|nr:hypothetical protein FRC07_007353 [Ceratobasidium sp. 392]